MVKKQYRRQQGLISNVAAIVRGARQLASAAKAVGYKPYNPNTGYKRKAPAGKFASVKKYFGTKKARTETQSSRKRYANRAYDLPGIWAGKFYRKPGVKGVGKVGTVKSRTEKVGEFVATSTDYPLWFGATQMTGRQIVRMCCLAALKKLAQYMRRDFTSEYDLVHQDNNSGVFIWAYNASGEMSRTERTFSVFSNVTWGALADLWVTDMDSINLVNIQFLECMLEPENSAGTQTVAPVSKLDMTGMLLDYKFDLVVRLQNRTGANLSTELNTDTVEANPLLGQFYVTRGSNPAITFTDDLAVTPTLFSDPSSGLIGSATQGIDLTNATFSSGLLNMFSRIQSPNLFQHVKNSARIKLQPGEIKYFKESTKGTCYFDTIFRVFLNPTLNQSGRNIDHDKMGTNTMFAFEKAMRTGTGSAPITIGYMINQYHTCSVRAQKKKKYIMSVNAI